MPNRLEEIQKRFEELASEQREALPNQTSIVTKAKVLLNDLSSLLLPAEDNKQGKPVIPNADLWKQRQLELTGLIEQPTPKQPSKQKEA